MFRKAAFLFVLLLLVSSAALAQSVEITPTFGYRFGGDFDDVSTADIVGEASLDDSEVYGLTVDLMTRDGWGFELLWSGQSTDLDVTPLSLDAGFKARTSTFHIGGIYQFRRGTSWQPFVVGTLGSTQLKSGGLTQNGFSYAAGGGMKFYFGNHFGARFQGSVLNSHYRDDDTFLCVDGTCWALTDTNNVLQFEATAGLIFRF